ncbi:hypothetical protein BOX15_Mlig027979g1 [Macrostomum lignano]|uniref:EF-hand domain-containing protein n=1 Tax=Macrostomum lignano TaxID=282301 RepID=A0A267DTC4_9PLAT|nr:hypothetical protein BOX15_Mlig027979g1 [Macrostomum lignano]
MPITAKQKGRATQQRRKQPPADEEVWKAAFKRLDKRSRGAIAIGDLGEALRRAKFVLSEEEVQDYAKDADPDASGTVELPNFLTVAARAKAETLSPEQWAQALDEAFLTFDKVEAGRLKAEDLQGWLTQLGEPLEAKEVAQMLRGLVDENGMVVYQDLVKRLAKL